MILSENAVTEYRDEKGRLVTDTLKWEELTEGVFETHTGCGSHNQMLYEPALTQNAEIIQSILAQSTAGTK
jgi:thioesterase domain-containing protein